MKHATLTLAMMAALVFVTAIVRAVVLAGYGWLTLGNIGGVTPLALLALAFAFVLAIVRMTNTKGRKARRRR